MVPMTSEVGCSSRHRFSSSEPFFGDLSVRTRACLAQESLDGLPVTQRVCLHILLTSGRVLLQATPPATPDPPPPAAGVAGFAIAPLAGTLPANNPCACRGTPNTAQRPATPPSALANSLRSSPSPPRETEAQVPGPTPGAGQAVSAEELAKQTARRVKVVLRPVVAWPCLCTRTAVALRWALDF